MARRGRLRKGREFNEAYEQGTVSSGPFFVIRVRRNGLACTRAGYAVGKKLVPLATSRNQVRRRLREALRALELPAGLDVIVSAKRPATTAAYIEMETRLRSEATAALVRAGVR